MPRSSTGHSPRAAVLGDNDDERGPGDRPRSGRALVEVMEPTDMRDGHHAPELGRMHLAWLGTVVVKRLVWPRSVVVTDVAA